MISPAGAWPGGVNDSRYKSRPRLRTKPQPRYALHSPRPPRDLSLSTRYQPPLRRSRSRGQGVGRKLQYSLSQETEPAFRFSSRTPCRTRVPLCKSRGVPDLLLSHECHLPPRRLQRRRMWEGCACHVELLHERHSRPIPGRWNAVCAPGQGVR